MAMTDRNAEAYNNAASGRGSMQQEKGRRLLIAGTRRKALIEELRAARSEIVLCALAGYGKSTFTHLLRSHGVTVTVHEERRLLGVPAKPQGTVLYAIDLAFDAEELALLFAPLHVAPPLLERIAEVTRGWPVGALFLRRLAQMGVLDQALADLTHSAFDDLVEYVEENVYAPASRTQRLALLTYQVPPLLTAAIRARHAGEVGSLFLRRALTAGRRSREVHAARWFLAAGNTSEAADIIARLPFESLQGQPELWSAACASRVERIGPTSFAAEAAVMAEALERATDTALHARAVYWLHKSRARLAIRLFEGKVVLDGHDLSLVQRESAVLFTIAASANQAIDAKKLASTIWPELDTQHAHGALKVTASRLRAKLGEGDFLRSMGGKYSFGEHVGVDIADLVRALETCERTGDARELDTFFEVVGTSRLPHLRHAEWFAHIESMLVRLAHRVSDILARDATARKDTAALRRIGRALLDADACDEQGCALVVRGYLIDGHVDAARLEYDRFSQCMQRELGCAPSITLESLQHGEFV